MAGNLTFEERKWILREYWKCENISEVQRSWEATHHTTPLTRKTIRKLKEKFDESGTVKNAPKSGRPKDVNTVDNKFSVALAFTESPKKINTKDCS